MKKEAATEFTTATKNEAPVAKAPEAAVRTPVNEPKPAI